MNKQGHCVVEGQINAIFFGKNGILNKVQFKCIKIWFQKGTLEVPAADIWRNHVDDSGVVAVSDEAETSQNDTEEEEGKTKKKDKENDLSQKMTRTTLEDYGE